jgi:hypothetical protein
MKMSFPILRLSIALFVVLVGSLPAMANETHVGKIVFAGDGKLVISDVDDSNEVFLVPDDAKITRDGKEASLSDLATGDAVTVTASRKNGKLIAKTISAMVGK